jgi:hypothetical protein
VKQPGIPSEGVRIFANKLALHHQNRPTAINKAPPLRGPPLRGRGNVLPPRPALPTRNFSISEAASSRDAATGIPGRISAGADRPAQGGGVPPIYSTWS